MTITRFTKMLVIAALFGCASVYATESPIQVAMEDGKTIAQFKIGDSRCALVDGQVRCTLGK
jgi:hypothetical protein